MRIITQDQRTSLEFGQVSLAIFEKTETTCEIIALGHDYRQTTVGEYDKNNVDERFQDIHKAYEDGQRVYWVPAA